MAPLFGARFRHWLRRAPAPADPLSREALARRRLRGEGIEIGALHAPLRLPPGVRVRYVDRLPREKLREHYPELQGAPLVEPDVIDDGERLATFADGSLDFIVACHFLEHCEDPLGALGNFMRVLRPGGVALLAVPDMRYTFDRERAETSFEHLVRDHREGPAVSRRTHYEEWIRIVNRVQDPAWAANRIEHYLAIGYSIHFHCWSAPGLLEMLTRARRELALPCTIELFHHAPGGEEALVLLRREAQAGGSTHDG